MGWTRLGLGMLGSLASVGSLGEAQGSPATWEFAGEVNLIRDEPGILAKNGIDIVTPFSVSFTFEPTTPDVFPDNAWIGVYVNAVTTLSGSLGDTPFVWDGSRIDIEVVHSSGFDSYALRGNIAMLDRTEAFSLFLEDSSATIFSTDEIPLVPLPLDVFDVNLFGIGSQNRTLG